MMEDYPKLSYDRTTIWIVRVSVIVLLVALSALATIVFT